MPDSGFSGLLKKSLELSPFFCLSTNSESVRRVLPAQGQERKTPFETIQVRRKDALVTMRVGIGYDSHRFLEGRKLILGGVEIQHSLGLSGHSDADALIHAICDALLGAAGMGDIGALFPDSDPANKNRSSLEFLREIRDMLQDHHLKPVHIDATVIAEAPKLRPHIPDMCGAMAKVLGMDPTRIGVKAKTNETMGFVGRGEGIAVFAVALLEENI